MVNVLPIAVAVFHVLVHVPAFHVSMEAVDTRDLGVLVPMTATKTHHC